MTTFRLAGLICRRTSSPSSESCIACHRRWGSQRPNTMLKLDARANKSGQIRDDKLAAVRDVSVTPDLGPDLQRCVAPRRL